MSLSLILTSIKQGRTGSHGGRYITWYFLSCRIAIATVTPRKHRAKAVCTGATVFVIAGFPPWAAGPGSACRCWGAAGPPQPHHRSLSSDPLAPAPYLPPKIPQRDVGLFIAKLSRGAVT